MSGEVKFASRNFKDDIYLVRIFPKAPHVNHDKNNGLENIKLSPFAYFKIVVCKCLDLFPHLKFS